MAERVRVEIGFAGHTLIAAIVEIAGVDALEKALAGGEGGVRTLEAEDGTITVVVSQVVYLKRFARESRVGFGAV